MTYIRSVVACPQCEVHWYVDDEAAKCTFPDHDNQRFDRHFHRSVVVLPDGTEVTAVSFDARDPYARDQAPDFGSVFRPAVGSSVVPRSHRLARFRRAQ